MKRLICYPSILLFIAVGCITTTIAHADEKLQFDGVYRSPMKRIGSTSYWKYLRFSPNGTAITVSTSEQPEDLRKWLSIGKLGVSHGLFEAHKNNVSFTAVTSLHGISIDYKGEIQGNKLTIHAYNKKTRNQWSDVYTFVRWQPEAVATNLTYRAQQTIRTMNDSELCEEVMNESFTGEKSLCLDKDGEECLEWSEDRVNKDDFKREFNQRYSSTDKCEEILNPPPKKAEFVLIDSQNPSFCLLFSLSSNQIEIVELQSGGKGIEALNWDEFYSKPSRYLNKCMLINEYKGYNLIREMPEILKKLIGIPIGLTWNGGFAFTAGDYKSSEDSYRLYTKNPQDYLRSRSRDPRGDPINPGGHLPFFRALEVE